MKFNFIRLALLAVLTASISAVSCQKIFDYEGDCSVHCQLKFKYDMNMKFADAFANTVDYVTVYVYDINTGELLRTQTESGEVLANDGYTMELKDLDPGTYDVVAWCGDGLKDGHFEVAEDLTCKMDRENGGIVNKDVRQLYHAKQRVTFEDGVYGTQVETINLTKNTNTVRVVLQHLSGIDVDPEAFRFEITDENGLMASDNTVLDDEVLTYRPWSVTAGSAGVDATIYAKAAVTSVNVALAEFTVGRLVTENNPMLSIYNVKDNDKLVLSIPLKDYALLVKGNYNKAMSDQEYLDRQDEYNLTFFLDEYGLWTTSRIIINSWHLVIQDSVLM